MIHDEIQDQDLTTRKKVDIKLAVDPNARFEISEDLQRNILNLIIMDRDFLINSIKLIEPSYFENSSHRILCEIIYDYFKNYNSHIIKDILFNELKNKYEDNRQLPKHLAELDIILEKQSEAYESKDYLQKAIIQFAKQQAMKSAIMQSVDLLSEEKYEDIDLLVKQALMVSPEAGLGMDFFKDVNIRYQRIIDGLSGQKFPMGFPGIDRELEGGMSRKEVGVFFAPAGGYKSVILANIAIENVIRGQKVLYISSEMSEERVALRLDAIATFTDIKELTTSLIKVKKRLEKLQSTVGIGELKIKDFPAGDATINDIRIYMNQEYNYTGFYPDMIILDYLDEMKCSNPKLSLYEGQQQTLREFRALLSTGENGICGLTATQANREGRRVEIITDSELADSYGKVRVADAMWSINQNTAERVKGVGKLFVVKQRNGNSQYIVPIKICNKTLRIHQISSGEMDEIMGINQQND